MSEPAHAGRTATEWPPPDAGAWELETDHGRHVAAVPMRTRLEQAFADGFRNGLGPMGLPLSHLALRHVNGWPYVSSFVHGAPRKIGKAPPDIVLKLVMRLLPASRARTKVARAAIAERRPQRIAEDWFAERQQWIDRLVGIQEALGAASTDAEFAAAVRRAADAGVEGFQRHFELIPGCIPLGRWLFQAGAWGLPLDDARQAVMHSTPVHDEARRRIRRLADALGDARPHGFGEIRAHSDEAADALDDYLTHHGWWATEDRVGGLPVQAFPQAVLSALAASREPGGGGTPPEQTLGRLRERVPASERAQFDELARDAHRSYQMLDDDSGILGAWATGVAGSALRGAGERLAADGRLHDAEHVWALEVDEITGLLEGHGRPSADVAAERWASWRTLADLDPPPYLNGPSSPPPDPPVLPEPVRYLMTGVGAFLDDKFNGRKQLVGIGTRTVRGRAVVAVDASEAMERLEPGDILVTTATTPAYDCIMSVAGGVVVASGGPSCHTAVVARELGIPAVVGLAGALTTIPDGAIVELDPSRPSVTVVPAP